MTRRKVNMMNLPAKQKGASVIVTIIGLALLAYGVYIGIQYVPQVIESKAVGSIFSSIEKDHKMEPIRSEDEARAKVVRMLNVNELNELAQNLSVRRKSGAITLRIKYERELNLGYKSKLIVYEKTLALK